MSTLYQRVATRGVRFKHICEVGVFEPETSNVLDFIKDNIKATLVEADPVVAVRVEEFFKAYRVTVYPVAVWDYAGKQRLARNSASTFVVDVKSSPAIENDDYKIDTATTVEVNCVVFSSIDDGTIDLISIDIEGSEWYVLKYMVSRPNLISIETHGKNYVNPFIDDIAAWMSRNEYVVWYKDNADSVYIKRGLFELTLTDKLALIYRDVRITLRKQKLSFLKRTGIR